MNCLDRTTTRSESSVPLSYQLSVLEQVNLPSTATVTRYVICFTSCLLFSNMFALYSRRDYDTHVIAFT